MEAGEGEEGRDCLLETQEESPSASTGEPSPPPANFSSSSAPFLPLGLTKALPPSPRAWSPGTSPRPQPRFPTGHRQRLSWLPPSGRVETNSASLCL